MKYFKLIRADIDVSSLYSEILNNETAWFAGGVRREHREPIQQDTNTIHLRTFVRHPDESVKAPNNQESYWTILSQQFPLACKFISNFAESIDGELSRALIVRLKPKGMVCRHIDYGSYYLIRDRYHLVIKSAGCYLYSGDEKVQMQEGELWWFDNHEHHQAENPTDDWRIHCIFDILPKCYSKLAKNPKPLNELPNWFKELPVAIEQSKN